MSWLDRIFRREQHRRREILARPFPDAWSRILQRNVPYERRLSADQQQRLRQLVQIFIAEKTFAAWSGVTLDDEIKVTIAGTACILLLGIPHLGVYPKLREIIVCPHDFGEVVDAVGPDGRPWRIPVMHVGEAWRRGPVVLAWDSVRRAIAAPCDGYNVVFHEFAHVLDMMTGEADGVPPLQSKQQAADWQRVLGAEFRAFLEAAKRGRPTFLDPYGAEGPAEFFAVVTEHFFEQPREMKVLHPQLYEQLRGFYAQDPATWRYSRTGHWR